MNIATLIIEIFFLLLLLFQIICLSYKIGKKRGFMESLEENQRIDVVLYKTMREFLTDEQIEKFSARLRANWESEKTEMKFHKNRKYERDQ